MKRSAAAIVLVAIIVAADLAAQVGARARPRPAAEPPQAECPSLTPAFENQGILPDAQRNFFLSLLRSPGRARPGDSSSADCGLQARKLSALALGRLELPDLIAPLAALAQDPSIRRETQLGLLLTLRANAPGEGSDEVIDRAVDSLIGSAFPLILGQLPYSRADQFDAAETRLAALLNEFNAPRAEAARALEALARRNRRLGRLKEETLDSLVKATEWELPVMNRPADTPMVFEATAALMAASAMTAERIATALRAESPAIRRLGALALYGGGASIDAAERTRLTEVALHDRHWTVRYDGLRAWVRRETPANGCGRIVDALSDESAHVALAAIDALADHCMGGEEGDLLTARLVSELRTPPNIGPWHREAHALVALARRDRARAAISMPSFRQHLNWQVRMYAARAAGFVDDVLTLEKLAYDSHDNVRDAALPPLRRLKKADSDPAFIAALARPDYQLVLTAATALKGAPPDKDLTAALVAALERITADRKDTSRDIRLALIERIREQGVTDPAIFEKLLTDFDPRIAAVASQVLRSLGAERAAAPNPLPREPVPSSRELSERLVARAVLDTGRFFEITFDKTVAPLAYARIRRLVRQKYYDGLTFHRVVPNFVIQGGSPGANEYSGAALFMRDELSARPHSRGTVGLSTRGHHTGDAQLFVNLADNRMLDFEYTVIGEVNPAHMAIVDAIQEGTRIVRMQMLPPTR